MFAVNRIGEWEKIEFALNRLEHNFFQVLKDINNSTLTFRIPQYDFIHSEHSL